MDSGFAAVSRAAVPLLLATERLKSCHFLCSSILGEYLHPARAHSNLKLKLRIEKKKRVIFLFSSICIVIFSLTSTSCGISWQSLDPMQSCEYFYFLSWRAFKQYLPAIVNTYMCVCVSIQNTLNCIN